MDLYLFVGDGPGVKWVDLRFDGGLIVEFRRGLCLRDSALISALGEKEKSARFSLLLKLGGNGLGSKDGKFSSQPSSSLMLSILTRQPPTRG